MTTTHIVHVENRVSGFLASCTCGWRSSAAPACEVAELHADRHADDPDARS